ncbi:MAG: hypothetical protein ACFCBW_09555 [Candidatus Competibacterales bacterium]
MHATPLALLGLAGVLIAASLAPHEAHGQTGLRSPSPRIDVPSLQRQRLGRTIDRQQLQLDLRQYQGQVGQPDLDLGQRLELNRLQSQQHQRLRTLEQRQRQRQQADSTPPQSTPSPSSLFLDGHIDRRLIQEDVAVTAEERAQEQFDAEPNRAPGLRNDFLSEQQRRSSGISRR